MGSKAKGIETMGIQGMKRARLHTRGFTLIASLLMLLLLSGIAIGFADDGQHRSKVAEPICRITSRITWPRAALRKCPPTWDRDPERAVALHQRDLQRGQHSESAVDDGVTWTQYLVQPTSGCGTSAPSNPTSFQEPSTPGRIKVCGSGDSDQHAGYGRITGRAGSEHDAERADRADSSVPIWRISESDLSYFAGSNLDFVGPRTPTETCICLPEPARI